MTSDLERNKQNVRAFYELMFNECKPREAIERYAGAEYRQHNPHVGDGKEAFIDYFERMAREGTLTTLYNRWLTQPLPTGVALNLPMSPHLAEMYRALGSPD